MFQKLQFDYNYLFGEQPKSTKGVPEGDRERQRISGFLEQWGWDYSISQCVIDTGLSEDEIYDWNVIRFHNKLAYLKDKGKFEIALNGSK